MNTTQRIIREDGTEVTRQNNGTYIEESIFFPNGGKIIKDRLKCVYIKTYYTIELRPYNVYIHYRKGIKEFCYVFNIIENDDGTFITEDVYVHKGPFMRRKYQQAFNDIPIIYIDGVFTDADLVDEIQI